MSDLIIPVKAEFFHAIRSGSKTHEYRERKEYWRKRLVNRNYDRVIITLGYPSADDYSKRIVCKYKGFTEETITHHHFGNDPIDVYAIDVTDQEGAE